MGIETSIRRVPRAFDRDRGAEALSAVPGTGGAVAELIRGTAGASPYLSELIRKEATWLEEALTREPDTALEGVFPTSALIAESDLDRLLRVAKRRVALWAALMDLGGIWSLEEVTGALTRLADTATDCALKRAVAAEVARGRLPGQTEADLMLIKQRSCGRNHRRSWWEGILREHIAAADSQVITQIVLNPGRNRDDTFHAKSDQTSVRIKS